ncbi:hypothetical protein FEN90_00335 [Salmonella enterica subsp. enterica serovar Muenster]|nr:hypothetical protein [Salmonella enterica subsp. enterica serovar Muenster]EDV9445373.1 hypothetical protein [Salmonella enterica subsp. enterica serovar Stanleyville]
MRRAGSLKAFHCRFKVVGNNSGSSHVGSPLRFNLRRFCRAGHNNTIHCRCGKNGTNSTQNPAGQRKVSGKPYSLFVFLLITIHYCSLKRKR